MQAVFRGRKFQFLFRVVRAVSNRYFCSRLMLPVYLILILAVLRGLVFLLRMQEALDL